MEYIINNPERVLTLTLQHLRLVGVAVVIASLIGVPLGILISRVRWLAIPVLNISGVLYTVPSLAFFVILIPYTGVGTTTPTIALTVYSLLVIVRNTAAGMDEVSAPTKDAAQGMGMTQLQLLRMVELPLALPYIFAGIRIATVAGIGVAAIAAVIGGGGLGRLIFDGIRVAGGTQLILAGAIMSVALALLADLLFGRLAWLLRPDLRSSAAK